MKQIGIGLLLSAYVAGGWAQNGSNPVELKDITDGKYRQITNVGEMRSLPDGEHYTAMNPGRTMIVKYAYRTGTPVDTLFNVATARECTFDSFDNYDISSTGHHILIYCDVESIYRRSSKATVYDYDVRRNYVKPLSDSKSKQMIPTFSPDGRMCAYVSDNNIWIRKFDYDTEIQITRDGELNKVLNGVTDWVYEEEFAITNLMAWSPDSEILAFVRSDESDVPEYSMQKYGTGTYPTYYNYKYPTAGEKNSSVCVMAYNLSSKDTKKLNVPLDADGYIPRIAFTTDPSQLAVMTLNRQQNRFQMYYANPKSGVAKLILKDENKCYVDSEWLSSIRFFKSGFTYVSEQDGYAHIYLYSPTGVMQRQVTKGNWDVTRLLGYDEKTKTTYYESAEESPMRRSVYKIDAKGKKTKLSTKEGTNSATFSANFAYYVNRFSNVNTPMQITVNETKQNRVLRTLQDNAALTKKLAQLAYSPKEFFTLTTASGYELNAWMIKPANFDENKKYPVMMTQYSGPNSQQVLDNFGFDWEYYLASKGDQVEAAQALGKLPYIDKERMAIWGWSFGGYNTLMALTVGKGTFKVGIAVAPPTDWRYYDTVYTERFMRTPQENEKGYNETSPMRRVSELQGKLLLIHGSADDNVHFLQSLQYAEALVQANKQFDMHVYKDRDHSIYGGNTRFHLYTKMANYLFENL